MTGDGARAHLRTLIEVVERELATTTPSAELRTAWADVVKTLALGPAPAMRDCPTCKAPGMAAASRCGTCWAVLVPVAP